MNKWLGLSLVSLLGVGCSAKVENLKVDKFTLRSVEEADINSAMVRGDQLKRLHGAVTLKEREARLGHYYEINWNLDGYDAYQGEVLVIFRYRQASTASELKVLSQRFTKGERNGKIEFNITGEEYKKKGRVLAWKAELVIGGRAIASKQSYLWR